jgi:ribosome-associated protein
MIAILASEGKTLVEEEVVSKTRRKQEMQDLQTLGEALLDLSEAQIRLLDLPEKLHDAVMDARKFSKHGAVRRQLQYIGRLMRTVDAEPIRAQLDAWEGSNRGEAARQHWVERWRERLIDDDANLGELAKTYPGADLQRLRALARSARVEREAGRPPKHFRELFRELKALLASTPAPAALPSSGDQNAP